jgi:polysaccharide biosynthesis protein PslG
MGVAMALAWAAPATAQVSRSFYGMQAWGGVPEQQEFDRMARIGVGMYREEIQWQSVEPSQGARNWGFSDELMTRAARAGIDVLPALIGVPDFASVRRGSPFRSRATRSAYARFVQDFVDRYGRNGGFWHAHPELEARPLRAVQIWNEPNLNSWWWRRPNPREYVTLLKTAAQAIRSRDRSMRVITGGIPESRFGMRRRPYLHGMYRAGAKRWFDGLGMHAYATTISNFELGMRQTRSVMRAHGDGRTLMWVTEIGWATAGPPGFFVTTPEGQAERLEGAYGHALGRRRRHRIATLTWFTLKDRPLGNGERDWWAPHTGLLDVRGNPKPAWAAYARVAGGQP